MATTTVYLTRHGQTEWNVQQRMQGHQDSPLTPLGVQQAEWLGKGLREVPLDAVYASSSPRTLRTAEIILGERGIPVTACDEFKELCMGAGKAVNLRHSSWLSRSSSAISGKTRSSSVLRAVRHS